MNDKLVRKTVRGEKFTTATVTMVGQQVQSRIDADRYDDALTAYREVNAKYTPADKPAADAWLRLSGTVFNGYEAKLLTDRLKPWADLRIPPLERDLDALRKTKPTELALLQATNTLAFSYLYAGRNADVVKLTEEAIARQKANGWRTDSEIVPSYASLSKAVTLAGRADLGTEVGAAVLAELQKKPNVSKGLLATATFSLGFAKSHAGSHAGAEDLFREDLRLQSEADAKHWSAAKYRAWLGFALHDRKKYAAAEPILLEAHAEFVLGLAAAPTWEKQHPLLLAERLASLYEATNQPDKAAEWKARREKSARSISPESSTK